MRRKQKPPSSKPPRRKAPRGGKWLFALVIAAGCAGIWFIFRLPVEPREKAPAGIVGQHAGGGGVLSGSKKDLPRKIPETPRTTVETEPPAARPDTFHLPKPEAATKEKARSSEQPPPTPSRVQPAVPAPTDESRDGIRQRVRNEIVPDSLAVASSNPRHPQNLLEAQIALARLGISPGSLDGVMGRQTRAALSAFQSEHGLAKTGELDTATRERLLLDRPPLGPFTISSNELARLQPVSPTWLGKSQQSSLQYETILELVAEMTQSHPGLIRRLNPDVNWTNVEPGLTLVVPDIDYPEVVTKAAFLRISLNEKTLRAYDGTTNLLVQFPCSIARRVEKRPVGVLHVSVIAPNPNYTFDPEVFPESAEGRELGMKLVLPPGPNNPVGVAWIGLDKPGYGIHGTPSPEQVGRTESHGCFRLANWNAAYLLRLVTVGTPVEVEP